MHEGCECRADEAAAVDHRRGCCEMKLLMLFAGAYVAGSVNFPILLFKLLKKADPRSGFSKNPGDL